MTKDASGVDVVAMCWTYGEGTAARAYPLVMLSYRAELPATWHGPDRRDSRLAALLAEGWDLVTDLNRNYPAAPAGYGLRFTHTGPGRRGRLEFTTPRGPEADTEILPGPRWISAAQEAGMAALILGTRYLTDWESHSGAPPALKQALLDGALAAAVVPIETRTTTPPK
ncbi:hypothetical protein ACFORH_39070 [Amycolatopsis roodepoortensis]|uniref:Uncharacterized protein n=1 Tax=Amycolatopsis roodepoortensis TaxID=700274 RepID=A0ABR9LIZ8_9PSEU|nr:hypothetical protein [Amycolatopsis roodepoortensis]MBE1580517.1 hypothetical protein [Amycolatopsis roodepoortensis]